MSKNLSEKKLIRRERISITALVMGVMLLFILGVAFFVPYLNSRNLRETSYNTMNIAVKNATQAEYGYGSTTNINPNEGEDIFIVLIDEDGLKWEVGKSDANSDTFVSLYTQYRNLSEKELSSFSSRRWNLTEYDCYLSIMGAAYLENMLVETNRQEFLSSDSHTIISDPIDVPDEAIMFAGINRKAEFASHASDTTTLIIILAIAYLILIPVVFLISGRVMKPTRDTIKHEKEFVANASHELKTPLAIITAQADLWKMKNPENKEYYQSIIQQCQNMNETVLDMIDLSKLETAPKELTEVNLSQLVLDLCLSFDAVAFERGIQYSYDIESHIVLPKADKKNLTRLVNLLIDNAMKYTEGEKRILVTLKSVHRQQILEFYNTGCQVLDEDREKVFERFYQGRSGSDRERKGSGLGLAIVKQICETYGYSVSVDSHYQEDTKFTIILK